MHSPSIPGPKSREASETASFPGPRSAGVPGGGAAGVNQEAEAKFLLVDDAEAEALLRALGRVLALTADRTLEVTDTYIDSWELELYRAGFGCRIRCRNVAGAERWTLECKSRMEGGGDVKVREEVEQLLPGPTTVAGLPEEGPVIERLRHSIGAPPIDIVQIKNRRRRYRAQWADIELEISLDDVNIVGPQGVGETTFRELEIERVCGPVESLANLVETLRTQVPLRSSRLGKLDRALWLSGRNTTAERTWSPADPARWLLKAQLQHDLRVIGQSREIALEGHDPEGIHRLRTHVRRLRATLEACGDTYGNEAAIFDRRFKALADAAGEMRDHDVYAAATLKLLQTLPGVRERTLQQFEALLGTERARIRDEGLHLLCDAAIPALFAEFTAWIDSTFQTPPERIAVAGRGEQPAVTEPGPSIGELAAKELARRTRSVRKGIQKLVDDGGDAALHTLRIRIKKLRYVLELFEPVLGHRMAALMAVLRGLQDRLGDHQDACVAVTRGQTLAASVPLLPQNRDVLITLGRLQRERENVAAGIRDGFLSHKGRKRLAGALKKALKKL